MAMQKRLWSVNALAVELGRDRRTVAKVLDGVPPDGRLKGHAAWYLEAALSALNGNRATAPRGDGLVTIMLQDRVEAWGERDLSNGYGVDMGIDEFAAALGRDRAAVLVWLKAGMPFATMGDWETGEGFVIKSHWAIDWQILTYVYAKNAGEMDAARALRIVD